MPADISGTNNRVVEVMNFLAAHPTESFTLSEIASSLGLSNGSAHRVLTTLAEARYLSRHPRHKTYSLGMALVAIGQAALAQHRYVDVARQEMAQLAAQLNVKCLATTVVDNELLILANEGMPQTYDPPHLVGERRPFIPPLGMGHVAWADQVVQDEYLSRTPAAVNEQGYERLVHSLKVMRERGYGIAGSGPAIRALRQFTSLPVGNQADEAYWSGLRQLLSDLTVGEIQILDLAEVGLEGVSYITAPVFGPDGGVALELSLSGMRTDIPRAEIERVIDALRNATLRITHQIHGRMPALPATASTPGITSSMRAQNT